MSQLLDMVDVEIDLEEDKNRPVNEYQLMVDDDEQVDCYLIFRRNHCGRVDTDRNR